MGYSVIIHNANNNNTLIKNINNLFVSSLKIKINKSMSLNCFGYSIYRYRYSDIVYIIRNTLNSDEY